jgi:hypothetical protein
MSGECGRNKIENEREEKSRTEGLSEKKRQRWTWEMHEHATRGYS